MSGDNKVQVSVVSERVLSESLRELVERINVEHGLQVLQVTINWNCIGPDAKAMVISSNVAAVMQPKSGDSETMN